MTAPDPRLGEIEARLAAATPGPWIAHDLSDAVYSPDDKTVMEPTDRSPNDGSIGVAAIDDNRTGVQEKADAEFIAHSPADVAYLLAELRKRDEKIARVTDVLDNWQAEVPFQDAEETQRWYSLGKRHAAERIRSELKEGGE